MIPGFVIFTFTRFDRVAVGELAGVGDVAVEGEQRYPRPI
jgi:hypothetical protein